MNDISTLLETALSETKNLKEGETFLVKDLFKGYLWNRIPKGDRLLLGSLFLSYVGRNDSDLMVIKKGASGQQMYQKTRRADTKS
ncbi:MAG: single-stranded DNA-binding protein [Sphaerochaeta sp.]|nr:single-stranded DNA-binding protein [Sphaerochaeta sp.]